jgi:WD40 repeat protein
VCTLKGHKSYVCSVAFSMDGKKIVSGSNDMVIKIWNAETGAEVSSFVLVL